MKTINARMLQEVRLQATLHRLPLPDNFMGETESGEGEKRKPLTPEQEAAIAASLKEAQRRIRERHGERK